MKKLAIVVTHPIQYYVPLFQELSKSCVLKVFYTWGEKGAEEKYDRDFKKVISWDLPLLEGYDYVFLENIAKDPGSHKFSGIINPMLIKEIEIFNPAAILIYGWSYQSHLQILRKFKGKIPIWFRGDSNLLDGQRGIRGILRNFWLKWVYQHIDSAFYVGTANKEYYLKFGLQPKQLIFAPHAVDNDRFAADRKVDANSLREKLAILEDEILILFAGKLEPKKNPTLLLHAFTNLNIPNVRLLFVGNGVLEENLKKETATINEKRKTNIHFMDFQNQKAMPAVYQACDLFCLPSKGPGETWGLAVNEAMAAGKPILVSDKVGCAVDLVKPLINGEIFKSDDLKDLQTKLNFLLTQPELFRNMGGHSKEIIKNWNIKTQATTILKVLNTTNESK